MEKMADDVLLRTFAELLAEKQTNTLVVQQALQLICENYHFECASVYEIDQNNQLHLKEGIAYSGKQLHEDFPIDAIKPEYRKKLATDSITYIVENTATSAFELDMLDFFDARSLLVVSAVDEKTRVYGLVVFFNMESKAVLTEEEVKTLFLLLSIFSRCIGIRIYQNKLSFAQSSLESILENAGIDIYVTDYNTQEVLYANHTMAGPYGGISRFVGRKCWDVLFPGQSGLCDFCPKEKLVDEEGNPTRVYVWDYQRPFDGSWFRVFSAAFRWVDGRMAQVVSSADITDNKKNEELINYLANYDSLTRLPNRRMLLSECARRIDLAQHKEKAYLLFFDIDGFKAINDNHGHDAGDEFLVQLGEFFTSIPMLKNGIYRNGGDEFVALISGEITQEHIRSLAGFIHERFKKPWVLKSGSVFCNTSIGVASYPEDGNTAEEILAKADQSMYAAKKAGGGSIRFA